MQVLNVSIFTVTNLFILPLRFMQTEVIQPFHEGLLIAFSLI